MKIKQQRKEMKTKNKNEGKRHTQIALSV